MRQRVNLMRYGSTVFKPMSGLSIYLAKCSIERPLLDLIFCRVSQINGCAYCIDMHAKDLRNEGESEQRLYLLNAWREAPFYSDRERAALAWAEAVTRITNGDVPDDVYNEAITQFDEAELVDLTLAVNTINSWNRFNIAFRTTAGSYQVGAHAVPA
jgi:AhpD family alkylhydroperoxidase